MPVYRYEMSFPIYTYFQLFLLCCYYSNANLVNNFLNNNLYYSPPSFDINFANVTLGATRFYNDGFVSGEALSLGESLSAICQAELINQNKSQFSINGIINLVFQDYKSIQSSGQAAIIALLSNSVNGNTTIDGLKPYNISLTGYFGISDFGTSKINSMVGGDFAIPFISAGDLARANPDNQFSANFPAQNRTFFQILDTSVYNIFSSVLQILNHFNWTLVGDVYQSNTFGYGKQSQVMDYSAQYSTPIFACNMIYYVDEDLNRNGNIIRESIELFCRCVNEKNKINVIVLWMSSTASVSFITILKDRCKEAKDWTFIVSNDFQSPADSVEAANNLKNSLLIRTNGPWDYLSFIQNCLANSSPQSLKTIEQILNDFLLGYYNCKLIAEEGMERCQNGSNGALSESLCLCDLNILRNDPYAVKTFKILRDLYLTFIVKALFCC